MQFKILSWNIWCDCDFKKVAEFLSMCKADIIGLQEVVLEDKRRDVIRFLTALGYHHAYTPSVFYTKKNVRLANAFFSRYPILSHRVHTLYAPEERRVVKASIKVADKTLTVFVVHIKHSHKGKSWLSDLQIRELIKTLPKRNLIVMGDFNATPDMTPIKLMQKALVDTDPTSALTWSPFTNECKVCKRNGFHKRFDYIFVSKDLSYHSFKVEKDAQGSDHLPVSVVVEL